MRQVAKRAPPGTVTETAKAPTTNLATVESARTAFNQIDKSAVRAALSSEQGWLCAFCMRRIDPSARDTQGHARMRIAHRIPLAVDPSQALTWNNLLGSCEGSPGPNLERPTCDRAQGEFPLTIDPTQPTSIARLRYERRGTAEGLFLDSDDDRLRNDVEKTLRLNAGALPAARAAAWKAHQTLTKKRFPHGPYGKEAMRAHLGERQNALGAKLHEYWGVIETMVR